MAIRVDMQRQTMESPRTFNLTQRTADNQGMLNTSVIVFTEV